MISHHERLAGVDPRLISLLDAIPMDVVVLCGVRDEAAQTQAFIEKRTKVLWPFSKHNISKEREFAEAVDVAPSPVNFEDTRRFYFLAGMMIQEAYRQGIPLRWGGDWDRDTEISDETFLDLGHFELTRENQCSQK